MTQTRQNQDFESIVISLWTNWSLSTGAIFLPVLLSVWMPMTWIPVVSLTLMLLLMLYSGSSFGAGKCMCYLIPAIAVRTLFISAVIMEVILFTSSHGYFSYYFDPEALNDRLPFIPVLIIAPVMLGVSIVYGLLGSRSGVCRRCTVRFGTTVERGFVGHIMQEESNYQLNLTRVMSAISTVISYGYYFIFYVNVNLNTADTFFLGWLPFIWFIIVIVFMGARYVSLWGYYAQDIEGSARRSGEKTWMRYLIICDNFIYLSRDVEFYDRPGMDKIDTPAALNVPYRDKPSIDYARQVFTDISNLDTDSYDLRFMYVSAEAEGMSNIYHYIITVKDKKALDCSSLEGRWYSISQLQRLLYNRDLSLILASEINRLYTVAMAWKTYDRDGNRLYKVKNYRPMFRFSGIGEWDVDFNDPHWLRVAQFNQDKPFFRIRRWYKRLRGEY